MEAKSNLVDKESHSRAAGCYQSSKREVCGPEQDLYGNYMGVCEMSKKKTGTIKWIQLFLLGVRHKHFLPVGVSHFHIQQDQS